MQEQAVGGHEVQRMDSEGGQTVHTGTKAVKMQATGARRNGATAVHTDPEADRPTVAVMQGEHAGQSNNIKVETEAKIKKWAINKYTDLFKRTDRFNNHKVRTKLVKRFEAK